MTQKAAAEALGDSSVHLSNVARGVTQPSASLMSRLTEVYGVNVPVLCYCTGDDLCYCTGDDDDDVPERVNLARRKLTKAPRRQLGNAVKAG